MNDEPKHQIDGIRAFSTTEAIVAVGLLGIVFSVSIKLYSSLSQAFRAYKGSADIIDLAIELRGRIDCAKTQAAMGNTCTGKTQANPQPVTLFDSLNAALVGPTMDTISWAPKMRGQAFCSDQGMYWAFQVKAPNAETGQMNRAFRNVDYLCPKLLNCMTQLPATPPSTGYWTMLFGPGTSGGKWCSGAGRLRFSPDATNFFVTLNEAWADDRCATIKLNGTTIFKDAGPCSGSGYSFFPNTNISAAFIPGDNVVTARAYDTVGNFCGAGMRATIGFQASTCNVTWVSDCALANSTGCSP